ncbi:hypothetical protein SH528x_000052 [Novipirellula sp. SH528]
MRIKERVRQAMSALVDRLLKDDPSGIELRSMSKREHEKNTRHWS